MSFNLSDINDRARTDPKGFIDGCDADYAKKVSLAADKIIENVKAKNSPIVLLSGPSGSGKTTTSKKLAEELGRRGIGSHAISLDNYFRSRDTYSVPLAPNGSPDFESPDC
ncbi:MAG: nucleoside kinase, partial [Firmicutes bacterium]|nr:nucleoside kinase [Bacillota bacterium]